MDEDQKHFWIVRPRPGGISIPVLQEEVARTFEEDGWEVERLPIAELDERELNCLRKVGWIRE